MFAFASYVRALETVTGANRAQMNENIKFGVHNVALVEEIRIRICPREHWLIIAC